MPLHFINDPYSSRAAAFGSEFGAGLGEGLQYLMKEKLESMQRQQQQKGLYNAGRSAGMSPEEANFYSMLPEKQGATFLSGWAQTRGAQPQYQQQMDTGMQAMAEQHPQLAQQQLQQQQELQQLLQSAAKPLNVQELLNAVAPRGPMGPQQQMPSELQQPQMAQPQQIQAQQAPLGAPNRIPLTPAEIFAKGLETPQMRQQRELAEKKLAQQRELAERKETAAERREAFKQTKEERKAIINDYKQAKDSLADLDRFEELEQSGNLDTPGYVEFLKRSGLDIPALMNPESEEFQKIANNFVRDAKTYFGGRVSNFEVDQFLKTIPSLSQSPEGRKRVIDNLKRLNRGKVEYYKSFKDIMNDNKNIPPLDLLEQVQEKADTKISAIADQFRKDLAKPVPKGQSKLITALQSTAGTVAGRLPKAAAGAGLGAYAGSKLGPAGTVAGGIIGGLGGAGGII